MIAVRYGLRLTHPTSRLKWVVNIKKISSDNDCGALRLTPNAPYITAEMGSLFIRKSLT